MQSDPVIIRRLIRKNVYNDIVKVETDQFIQIQLTFPNADGETLEYDNTAIQLPLGSRMINKKDRNTIKPSNAPNFKLFAELKTAEGIPKSDLMKLYFINSRIEKYPQTPFCFIQVLQPPSQSNTTHYTLSVQIKSLTQNVSFRGQQDILFKVSFSRQNHLLTIEPR